MTSNDSSKLYRDIVCPFCSLLCDDLSIRNSSEKLSLERHGCPKAVKGFERNERKVRPAIHGESVELEVALEHAASILKTSAQPLFAGCSTDVEGSRELLALAEKSGAIVDHAHGEGMMSNTLVLQSQGWITTTLAELKNRADLVIFIGTDAVTQYPRFFERLIWDQASLAGLKRNARDIVYIGEDLNSKAGVSPKGKRPSVLKCPEKEINETVSVIHALYKGLEVQANVIPARRLSALKKIVERIKTAKYGVIVWDASEFSATDGDAIIQSISSLIKEINQQSRFAGLSLGGNNGGLSFINVCAWQTGYPSRVNYNQGYPAYDPHANTTKKNLKNKSVDSLLWLSSFDNNLTAPRTEIPTIVISKPSRKYAKEAEVYIPIGTPGIDHSGNLIRTDSAVTLPLKKLRKLGLSSGSEILKKIRQMM